MTKTGWFLGALAVASIGVGIKGGCLQETTKAPDEKLAERFDDLCDIARNGVDSPVRGVKKLGHYMGKHTGDIMAEGCTLVSTSRMGDEILKELDRLAA